MAALVAAACLFVLQPRVYSQGHELDEYTDEDLLEDLTYELDDILDVFEDDEELVPVAALRTLLANAFSDDGDDADEQDISYADLVEEVAEVGRTMPQENSPTPSNLMPLSSGVAFGSTNDPGAMTCSSGLALPFAGTLTRTIASSPTCCAGEPAGALNPRTRQGISMGYG